MVGASGYAALEGHERVIQEIYAIDDMVIARWTISGTVDGAIFGIPADGAEASFEEIGFIRYDDQHRMVEGRFGINGAEFFNNIGIEYTGPTAE